MKLSKAEEQLMDLIWKAENSYMKELIDGYNDPKPASTTIATLLKRMQDKGFVAYNLHGNSRSYYPLVKKDNYFSQQVNGMIENHFDNSALQFASFFTKSTNMSEAELEDLKKIIEQQIKTKKQ